MKKTYLRECKHTLRRHSTDICRVAGIELTVLLLYMTELEATSTHRKEKKDS